MGAFDNRMPAILTPLQIAVYAVNCNNNEQHINEVQNMIELLVESYKNQIQAYKQTLDTNTNWYESMINDMKDQLDSKK